MGLLGKKANSILKVGDYSSMDKVTTIVLHRTCISISDHVLACIILCCTYQIYIELTCFSSRNTLHCCCCTPATITKCPCCNPVLSTWYCRADWNSPPSTCIYILSYHWYSKAEHFVSSNGSSCTAMYCCLIHHL